MFDSYRHGRNHKKYQTKELKSGSGGGESKTTTTGKKKKPQIHKDCQAAVERTDTHDWVQTKRQIKEAP